MSRRGFALLTVLWATAVAAAAVGFAVAAARLGFAESDNRITLGRAGWAREACAEVLLARFAQDSTVRRIDTVDLGQGVWCAASLEDPGAKLDLNRAAPESIRRLLLNDTLADALLDWRDVDDTPRRLGAEADWYRSHGRPPPRNGPLADLAELALVRGSDSAQVAMLAPLLTTRSTGEVNLGAAPVPVLAALPGMTDELLAAVVSYQSSGRLTLRPEELVGMLSTDARRVLLARYQDFARSVSYAPTRLIATVEGGVRGRTPTAREILTLVPALGRLATIQREVR